MYRPFTHPSQAGQVGIAVVLIMVLLSTVGISLATRATREVQTSRQTQEAEQTFTAAESAVEEILSRGESYLESTTTGSYSEQENVAVNYTIAAESQLTAEILENTVAEIDVTGATAGQQLKIEWAQSADCGTTPASLIVTIVNTAGATPVSRYEAYAICNHSDNFTLVNTAGTTLARQVLVTLQNGDSAVRVRPVYNDTNLLVQGNGWTLPTQQFTINTVARNERGRETKAIEVERTREAATSVFDFALVSGSTIIK